ncbi:MAG: helicase [Sphingomonadaceae bacterium]|nr:helicase [Sphingomonadaceae bacterium]
MASNSLIDSAWSGDPGTVKAVLGPTNTGKTHYAIERLCAHSSGAIGFPLRLLAREVYDRVCAIKGASQVALITGEERIEPKDARWLLCTVEAMPVGADLAFVGIDEAQLSAGRERGHIFTDRILHARGRDETMILGSATLAPMVKKLLPEAEVIGRPRFSTLSHGGAKKLSRIAPRSAIVAFSAEQVYAIAEMLRRFRGGAAVVMGALSPQTRNAQVELYQSGEVDYLVATDAIGMGLNLDIEHVAFAGLSKFDGIRQRRLTTAEMAQIAGRAGRHQRDGTFGTLTGTGSHDSEFTDEEVFAIEEHRFAPLTKLFWRDPEPRFDDLGTLIADLEAPPQEDGLIPAPEAIDLAILKKLSEEPDVVSSLSTPAMVARFWEVCSLPDFRQQGAETHSRFVSRLWQDIRGGQLGGDYVAQSIAQLDNPSGDIDTLQGRISATRSWAYIAQRPDWVHAKDEMAARARAVEARLSDALHSRLTERFVNRRTAILMKDLGSDAGLLSVKLDGEDVLVEDEQIGSLDGLRFKVDPQTRHADRKMLLAAAERHVPVLLEKRATDLAGDINTGKAELALKDGEISWLGSRLAQLRQGKDLLTPRLHLDPSVEALPDKVRGQLALALEGWLGRELKPLDALHRLDKASQSRGAGPELRALLIQLIERAGMLVRATSALDKLDKQQRTMLTKLGVRVGALDIFVPQMLRRPSLEAWAILASLAGRPTPLPCPDPVMPPAITTDKHNVPTGYRALGGQAIRIDIAEKLLREAHGVRVIHDKRQFILDPAKAISMGLKPESYAQLLRLGGFRSVVPKPLAKGIHGPPAPSRWRWRPLRLQLEKPERGKIREGSAFAALAELVR